MSIFRKILDKLGLRKEPSTIIGTREVAPPDPLSTVPTSASKVAPREKSLPPAKRTGSAPTSEKEVRGNQSTMDKKAKKKR